MVVVEAVTAKKHGQPPPAVAAMFSREGNQTKPQRLVVAASRAVVKQLAVDVEPATCRPLVERFDVQRLIGDDLLEPPTSSSSCLRRIKSLVSRTPYFDRQA